MRLRESRYKGRQLLVGNKPLKLYLDRELVTLNLIPNTTQVVIKDFKYEESRFLLLSKMVYQG
jgi:hypothetical protein